MNPVVLFRRLILFGVFWQGVSFAAVTAGHVPQVIDVNPGHGANVSYLEIDEASMASFPVVFAWHYDGAINPASGTNWSGTDLFEGIRSSLAGSANQLSVTSQLYGTNAYSQALITAFSFGGASSTPVNPSGSLVWTYWIRGGSEFEPYGDNGAFTFSPSSSSSWVISPSSSDTRWISNGSFDAWTISPFTYTGAPSDTHDYTDLSGHLQPVTFGTYTGAAPYLYQPPASVWSSFASLGRSEQKILTALPANLVVGGASVSVRLNSGLPPRLSSSDPRILRIVNGTTLQPAGPGKATVSVAQSGSTSWYQMASVTFTIRVNKPAPR